MTMDDKTQPLAAAGGPISDAPTSGAPMSPRGSGSTGTPGATGTPWTASPYVPEPRPVSTAVRTSTIVWGAILVVAAVVVLAAAAGMTLDLELVGIFVLGGAGVALLVGTVATQARRHR